MSWFDDYNNFVSDTCDSVGETLGDVASKVAILSKQPRRPVTRSVTARILSISSKIL